MAYIKHVWVQDETIDAAELNNMEAGIEAADSAITAMSTATSEDVGKALKAKAVADGRVTEWEFGEAGGGSAGPMQVVENATDLLGTTSDYVLVLKNDSAFGNWGPCIFYDQGSQRTRGGYLRSNGTRVYPMPSTMIPPANAPKRLLTGILKTWIGRTGLVHPPTGTENLLGLFAENCEADENGKFRVDCSDFVNAILLGITFNNSRYVLGKEKSNVKNEMMTPYKMPASSAPGKAVDGLSTRELAQWFAEQGRLFFADRSGENLGKTLRFGDILFGSNSTNAPASYFDIEHVMFCLGTMQSTNNVWYILLAECTGDTSLGVEGTACSFRMSRIYNNTSYYKVFARPNYRDVFESFNTLVPIGNGKYAYDCFWMPSTGNQLDTNDAGTLLAGHKYVYSYMASTDYCPVIPGSTIAYTGAVRSSITNIVYTVRCYEYDKNYELTTRGQTLVSSGELSTPITLNGNTKYVQFVMQYPYSENTKIRYKDPDDFAVEVTPPSGVAS